MAKNQKSQVRLNYTIPLEVESSLSEYCEFTGRSAADVIRQLIVDFNDGKITISRPVENIVDGRRTNLSIKRIIIESFDKKITTLGTRGNVIVKLLSIYLSSRDYKSKLSNQIYKDCFNLLKELVAACENRDGKKTELSEVDYWQALYACRVFLNSEVELDVY